MSQHEEFRSIAIKAIAFCARVQCDSEFVPSDMAAEAREIVREWNRYQANQSIARTIAAQVDTGRAAYDAGRRAKRAGCHRVLCNPESPEQLREWQRGYDDESADLDNDQR